MIHLKVTDEPLIPLHVSEVVMSSVIPTYDGSYEATPTEDTQTLLTEQKKMLQNVTINPIPSQYIVPSGTVVISDFGIHDVREYESANVSIASAEGVSF